jgi:hypothetical protein
MLAKRIFLDQYMSVVGEGLPDGIFKPKIPILVNFEGSCKERCWYIL